MSTYECPLHVYCNVEKTIRKKNNLVLVTRSVEHGTEKHELDIHFLARAARCLTRVFNYTGNSAHAAGFYQAVN